MKRFLRFLAALACGLGLPGAAQALTLEQALALAEANNPRLRAAAAQADAARAGLVTARALPNPDLEALFGRQDARSPYDSPEGGVQLYGLNQRLDLPGVREPRIRAAQAGLDGSLLALAESRLAVRAGVKRAFYDVLRRQEELELARETQKLIEDIRRRVQARVDAGEAPRLEAIRAEAESATATNAVSAAQLRLARATATLRAAIGPPLPDELQVVGDLDAVATLPELGRLREEMLANYPALAQARAEVRRAEARLETERALRIPQPSLRASFERQPDQNKFVVGIGVPIPVWDQRQGPIGEAVAALQEASAATERRQLELLAALEDAYERYAVASRQIDAFEGGLLRQAEAALRVAEAAYRFGERGFIEVLDAQRVLRTVRGDFLAARFDRQAALIDLEQLRATASAEGKR